MLILCLILIWLSVNMTCFCPCCYSCYCCSCCSDDSPLHAGIQPSVQGDRKRMICMAHTMLLEKPSPIKHPTQCLAHGICSARLISPVEMVLLFFSHVSVTSGLKGTVDYIFSPYIFFLSFFLLILFLKKLFEKHSKYLCCCCWTSVSREHLTCSWRAPPDLETDLFSVVGAPSLWLHHGHLGPNSGYIGLLQTLCSPHSLLSNATGPSLSRVFMTLKGVLRLLKNIPPSPTVFNM